MKGPICFAMGNVFSLTIGAIVTGVISIPLGVLIAAAIGICGIMADAKLS